MPNKLRNQLQLFQVDVPAFSMKKSRLERYADWLMYPVKSPLEKLRIRFESFNKVIIYPLLIVFIVSFLPLFLI